MLQTWTLQFPIARFIRTALRRKADTADARLSRAESLLLTSCEFWAAAVTRQLADYLRPQPAERLRAAYVALAAIGADGVARSVHAAIGELPSDPRTDWLVSSSGSLERQVVAADDPFDELIARFAIGHLSPDGADSATSVRSISSTTRV